MPRPANSKIVQRYNKLADQIYENDSGKRASVKRSIQHFFRAVEQDEYTQAGLENAIRNQRRELETKYRELWNGGGSQLWPW